MEAIIFTLSSFIKAKRSAMVTIQHTLIPNNVGGASTTTIMAVMSQNSKPQIKLDGDISFSTELTTIT